MESFLYNRCAGFVFKGFGVDKSLFTGFDDLNTLSIPIVAAPKTRIVKLHGVEKALYRCNHSLELRHKICQAIFNQQRANRLARRA